MIEPKVLEAATSAVSASAATRPRKEGTRQRFERYALAALEAVYAQGLDEAYERGFQHGYEKASALDERCSSCLKVRA
jgi:flagellar biosynthesis/type III secretory pathway protein FliH